MAAAFHVLFTGYVGERVASTVSFVQDGDIRIIIDPGMVPEPAAILTPLQQLIDSPDRITDVVLSHHHPDHTLNRSFLGRAFTTSGRSIRVMCGRPVQQKAMALVRQSG